MRVALYLRRSTDERRQADSLSAQHALLTAYATANGHEVVDDSFRDSASGRNANRTGFQRLIQTVQAGAPFEAVLVRDVTRWGRFPNMDESAFWEFYFLLHHVQVIYVEEGFREHEPSTGLHKMLRRFVAAEFSREKSRLVQYGQHRAINRGFRLGGDPPYGLVRVLLRPDGSVVQTLQPGERKQLADHRIKLAPGAPAEVAVVRQIFAWSAAGMTTSKIAGRLNDEGVPTRRQSRWTIETIRQMLTNHAYIGTATARFRASQNFTTPTVAACEEAWEALIPLDVWRNVQERLAHHRWRKSPDGLATQLRSFLEEHGRVDERVRGEVFRQYFEHGSEEAIERVYQQEITTATQVLQESLATHFAITSDGKTLLLNGALRVGINVGFPRGHQLGGIHWRFVFDGTEDQDVTIGIAMSPTGVPALYFHFVNMRFARKRCTRARRMHSEATKTAGRSLEQVIRGLKHDLLRYSAIAKLRFWEAIKELPLVNTYAAARSLGWNAASGLALYRRLKREGYPVPPLARQATGRRITIVCDDCGKQRTMLVSNALQHKTSLCRDCNNQRRAKYSTCPDCGTTRRLGKGDLPRLQDGANSRCRPCASRHNARKRKRHHGRFASTTTNI